MLIAWSATIETGIGAIDDDRKRLIEIVNLLDDQEVIKQARIFSPAFLESLRPIFLGYFDKEEDLMFRLDYPETNKHILAHSVLISSLDMAILNYKETGNPALIIDFVCDHFVNHLKSDETSFASFIQMKRRAQAARTQNAKPKLNAAVVQTSRQQKIPLRS